MRATTDSDSVIRFDQAEKPGISNLLSIYSVFTGKKIDEIVAEYEGSGYGQFKKDLVEIVNNGLAPIQEKYYDIRQSDELIRVLKEGTEKASAVAERTMKRVREKVGFVQL